MRTAVANSFTVTNFAILIETQDVIFGDRKAERFIEIGPGITLVNMAKHTVASKHQDSDMASGIRRRLLSTKMDHNEIFYEEDLASQELFTDRPQSSSVLPVKAAPEVVAVAAAVVPAVGSGISPVALSEQQLRPLLPNAPLLVEDVVKTLVASTLKIPNAEVSMNKTAREFAAGRSILQNEIVGYLEKEFGSLPHGVEDMTLADLCTLLKPTFTGLLGTQSQAMIHRMIASKMPASFNVRSLRKDLELKWSFASDRQDSVLLLATTMQPTSRFASETEAQHFIDTVVRSYSDSVGLTPLPTVARSSTQNSPVDQSVLNSLQENQDHLNKQLINVYTNHLIANSGTDQLSDDTLRENLRDLQSQLDTWVGEHGHTYGDGITSIFEPAKVRSYDSSWNWGMQALLSSFYAIINGTFSVEDKDAVAKQVLRIRNQCTERMVETMRYLKTRADAMGLVRRHREKQYTAAARFVGGLVELCVKDLRLDPVAQGVSNITTPHTFINTQGHIQYREVPRPRKNDNVSCHSAFTEGFSVLSPKAGEEWRGFLEQTTIANSHLRIKRKEKHGWAVDDELTQEYWDALDIGITQGITFRGKCFLITGASKGSIGLEILKGALNGGAKVVVTTRNYSTATARFYQKLYVECGAKGSRMVLVPYNQGSRRDVESLISHIYDASTGLGWDLDYVIPFAAISESGRDISNIDSLSELAHRVMLTNAIRILGAVKRQKSDRGVIARPALVILPLSPNHGVFGNDGLYSESKLALETLMNKWRSEGWGDYISICGASIGWTRGTGLMSANDIVAEGMEKLGVRTFSRDEMASNILGLMSPTMTSACQVKPMMCDLMGGMDELEDLHAAVSKIREDINVASEIRQAILLEDLLDCRSISGCAALSLNNNCPGKKLTQLEGRVDISPGCPQLPDYQTEVAPFHGELSGMVDLERVVVVTGFSEIGPCGNSRTRWEMEAEGELSFEGCVEMAWMMGLIQHHNGLIVGEGHYNGWIDTKTRLPIADRDVKSRYQSHILAHTGIRQLETSFEGSHDSTKKTYLHELVIDQELEPFEVPRETAMHLKMRHGDKVSTVEIEGSDQFRVQLKRGATLLVPKVTNTGRRVAGQIPTDWDPRTYGISEDIISRVDRVTLFSLVCTVEAFLCAGVTDPYEFYQYIHTSDIGICLGSSLGGLSSLDGMFKQRLLDQPVQSDVLQEAFINTPSAWVNMLLLSSNGPIRTPAGACATSLESLDTGYDLITSGKAKMCLVGGVDDLQDDMSFEFANMKATIDPEGDFRRGREPEEMSRPTATTRAGFVESHGCGLQVLTSAKLALDMGLPIYGVIALTQTASDRIGRSVPAPGRGILSGAREDSTSSLSPLLDIKYRRTLLEDRLDEIEEVKEFKVALLGRRVAKHAHHIPSETSVEYSRDRVTFIHAEAEMQRKEALYMYGNNFWKGDTRISPIRGALATWGLTIDDLAIASFHGTSTTTGDKNEIEVLQRQLSHLGRTEGNPIIGVFQKHLTGHPKGAAGAWMLNGCLQILNSNQVPGNRNADNIDESFQEFDHITFPSTSIQMDTVNAFSITSFGFGQKGAQAIGINPKFLFATLDKETYYQYQSRARDRMNRARVHFQNGMINNRLFVPKDHPPYSDDEEMATLLDPQARFSIFGFAPKSQDALLVPTDEVVPMHLFDDIAGYRNLSLTWSCRFDEALEPNKLRDSLWKLLEMDGWRKLGGRLRKTDAGKLEIHIPRHFTAERPPLRFSHAKEDMCMANHPVACKLPKATGPLESYPSTRYFKSLTVGPGAPVKFEDYLDRDEPQIALHVVSFEDGTVVSLLFLHTLTDLMGFSSFIKGWCLSLADKPNEIPPLDGVHEDAMAGLYNAEPSKRHLLSGRQLSGWRLTAWTIRFMLESWWSPPVESRTVGFPEELVMALRKKAKIDLAEGVGKVGGNVPFVSDGDILAALATRMACEELGDPNSKRSVTTILTADARSRVSSSFSESSAYVQNAAVGAFSFGSASDILQMPLGLLALKLRKDLLAQLELDQMIWLCRLNRKCLEETGGGVMFGDTSTVLAVVSNWSKIHCFDIVDFSPAVISSPTAEETFAKTNVKPGHPVYWNVQGLGYSKFAPTTFSIVGRDAAGTLWLTADLRPSTWEIFDKYTREALCQGASEMADP
ncbi:hypothetical protein G7046_g3948 [Stylonectria norvegica]|nr:hypothetical protein G7046_g3948 [Stylonectria norvegica]